MSQKYTPDTLTLSLLDGKVCITCNAWKTLSEFTSGKTGGYADGKANKCKVCSAAYNRAKASTVTPPEFKTCARCQQRKPITQYCNIRSRVDGKDVYCKPCRFLLNLEDKKGIPHTPVEKKPRKILSKEERFENARKRWLENPRTEKKCGKCKIVKPASEFPPVPGRTDGLCQYCTDCRRKQDRHQYARNAEKEQMEAKWYRSQTHVKERNKINGKKWNIANHEKRIEYVRIRTMRKNGNPGIHTRNEFEELCAQCNHKCLCCGKETVLTADHIVPVTRKGSNDISNIQPLCKSCNSSKHNKTIDYRPS